MQGQIIRKLYQGFIQIHILHHAKKEPFFGSWIMEELNEHGYSMTPGSLHPILQNMEVNGLILKEDRLVEGKVRKYYHITEKGREILQEVRHKALELLNEIQE